MMLPAIFVICVALVSEVPATRELADLFGSAVLSLGEAAGEVTGFFANKLARDTEDFELFMDKSQQPQRNFSAGEVEKCTGLDGCCLYIIYEGMVLDLTKFAPYHCGGIDVLLQYAGQDATAAMRESGMPPRVFDDFMRRFQVGTIERMTHVSSSSSFSASHSSSSSSNSSSSSSTSSSSTAPAAATEPCGFFPALLGIC